MIRRSLLVGLLAAAALSAARNAVPPVLVRNVGQASEEVRFLARGADLAAYFGPARVRLTAERTSVTILFEGGSPAARLEGVDPAEARTNFLMGNEADWHLDVPVYGGVRYRELYPGIDLVYRSDGQNLSAQFIVATGAD